MTVPKLEEVLPQRAQSLPLSALKGCVVGIEARHFLQRLLAPANEPLVSALGGSPFRLRTYVKHQLESLRNEGITPLFVFHGMHTLRNEYGDWGLEGINHHCAKGWGEYDRGEADKIVPTFTQADVIKPERYFKLFQQILHENKVKFMVAPYSAAAQLSYLANSSRGLVDCVAGSAELLMYEVDKIIFHIDIENSQFYWISRQSFLMDEFRAKFPENVLIDACILAGLSSLPVFPLLENTANQGQQPTIQDALTLINDNGRNVSALCAHYQDNAQLKQLNYLENFRRVRLAVQYHAILTQDGKASTLRPEKSPSDAHEFIGQRLPDELYFYLSKGVISPTVLSWLVSGEDRESAPLDGGESPEYCTLVQDKLSPLRAQSLSLLSQPLHRYFYSKEKDIRQRMWFDKGRPTLLNHRDPNPDPHTQASSWNVNESHIQKLQKAIQAKPGTISFALSALTQEDFVAKSFVEKKKPDSLSVLKTTDEIICNVIWGFLQIRGYIDDKHHLTAYGKAFNIIRTTTQKYSLAEEAVYLAVEMMRFNLLNTKDMFPSYSGKPSEGSEIDRDSCFLLARIGCFSTLRHDTVGYNGPLNRHSLGYSSMVEAVRRHSRDLIEVVLVSLLLNGQAERDSLDWRALGLSFPFMEESNCGLGVAIKTLLDLHIKNKLNKDLTESNDHILQRALGWVKDSVGLVVDMDNVWILWSGIVKAINETDVVDAKTKDLYQKVDGWFVENITKDLGVTVAKQVASDKRKAVI
ncbi:MAG: hypothetical protein M1814_003072 [Vezdaea aestivalis]|nr:MAG: hypothetical protein M1814_003072 [Vezdaea aestivalis]